jgi:hypothetical protein
MTKGAGAVQMGLFGPTLYVSKVQVRAGVLAGSSLEADRSFRRIRACGEHHHHHHHHHHLL